jgi:uncharacterized membrane protein SpoIIM required for sporulation
VVERGASWQRLEELLGERDDRGPKALPVRTLHELSKLLRSASADLIRARTERVHVSVEDYLNDLVGRGYMLVHGRSDIDRGRVRALFTRTFPQTFRAEGRAIGLAATMLLAGAAVGATFVARDPASLGALLPEMHQAHTPDERVQRDEQDGPAGSSEAVAFSGWLFTHNIQVSFAVFALGLTFGVGTVALLIYNGVPLGALAMQYHLADKGTFFWAWILPHGIPELTEVFVAGAAGLIIARGMWLPGRRRRIDAMIEEARTAVALVLGGMPILIVAGLIEGTISQIHEPTLPYSAKLIFALLVGSLLYYYLLMAGRDEDRAQRKSSPSSSSPSSEESPLSS